MPTLASITIADGQSTPVDHTFTPSGPDKNGINYWYDRATGIAIGFPSITMSLKSPPAGAPGASSKASRVYRAPIKVVYPIMEVTSPSTGSGIEPAPTLAYSLVFNGEFLLPERSTLQDRKDILAFAKNLLGTSVVQALVQNFEGSY